MKIINWNQLNTEQKADVTMALGLFTLLLTIACFFYVFSITFAQPFLLIASIIFFILAFIVPMAFIKTTARKQPELIQQEKPKEKFKPKIPIIKEINMEKY